MAWLPGRIDRGRSVAPGTSKPAPSENDLVRLALWSFMLYKSFNDPRYRSSHDLSSKELDGLMTALGKKRLQTPLLSHSLSIAGTLTTGLVTGAQVMKILCSI